MSLSTQPVKGARDFYPEDMRLLKYIFSVWREVCEQFGYEEYDAPILEPTELYLNKGNEEIIKEQTYTFTDRGDRSLTLRTEMTPTVSRMVAAKRQELAYPLRWYSIPQCWRYERMQRGRGREFYQLNVDLFGVDGLNADIEMVKVADAIMQRFGAKRDMYQIKANCRTLMRAVMNDYLQLDETQSETLGRLIDRMKKMERAEFVAQVDAVFTPPQREAGNSDKLLGFLDVKALVDLPAELQEAAGDLRELIDRLRKASITNIVFDPTVMRGFDYYTDIVFEVFDTDPENNRSMFGGGRYDGLVALYGVEPIPTVGFAMGDITLLNFLQSHGLAPELRTETDLYILQPEQPSEDAERVATELREMGLNVAVDTSGRKLEKQIKTAEKKGITYVLFVGEAELAAETYALKNLTSGETEQHGLQRIVSVVKDYRKA